MSLYKQPGSSYWWMRFNHNGVRIRESTGEVDRAAAQRRHDERKAELWRTAPKLRGRTWGMAVTHWLSLQTRSDSELLSLRKFARYYPDRVLTDVTREGVDEALRAFCRTNGTYMRYRAMIAAILNAAKEQGWLREVPKLISRADKVKAKPRQWITVEQWEKLLAELPAHMKPMATFAIETGLRQANVLGLSWDRVDIERQLVWVEAEDTKAGKALPVPLSLGAIMVLRGQLDAPTKHPTWVFPYRGKPVKEIKTAFQAACIRAGVGRINDEGRYEGFTWHGLRHTWATWHIQNGTPTNVLKDLGGWADERMVANYAHHSAGYLASFANNVRKP